MVVHGRTCLDFAVLVVHLSKSKRNHTETHRQRHAVRHTRDRHAQRRTETRNVIKIKPTHKMDSGASSKKCLYLVAKARGGGGGACSLYSSVAYAPEDIGVKISPRTSTSIAVPATDPVSCRRTRQSRLQSDRTGSRHLRRCAARTSSCCYECWHSGTRHRLYTQVKET